MIFIFNKVNFIQTELAVFILFQSKVSPWGKTIFFRQNFNSQPLLATLKTLLVPHYGHVCKPRNGCSFNLSCA